MSVGIRRCLRAFALAFLVSAAAAAQETTTFLDDWLQAENPVRVGCTILINKKTRGKIELVSLNPAADPAVHRLAIVVPAGHASAVVPSWPRVTVTTSPVRAEQ